MNAWALVPIKPFGRAKSRLDHLPPGRRAALAHDMSEHVLDALTRARRIAGALVTCPAGAEDVAELAVARGAAVVRDPDTSDLAAIIDAGLDALARRGADAAVVMMADLPLLDARDVDAVAALLDGADLVLAPDRGDAGTNALAVSLPAPMPTQFGAADSFLRHRRAAMARALRVAVYRHARIATDVDVPADYAAVYPDAARSPQPKATTR